MIQEKNALMLACVMAAVGWQASAQETITLRMGTYLPATNYGVTEGSQVFIDELERRTNGQVKIEFYPGEQAGKAREALELVKSGAIDIYEMGTGYYSSSDMPLWGLLEAPNMIESVCDGTRAMRALGEPGEILWETQYAPQGVRVLTHFVYPPYGPSASIKEMKSAQDLVGMKLRNAGGLMERTVSALGAVPVGITGPEVLQSLQRGTLDAYLGAYMPVLTFEYYPYAKYGATGFSMGTPGVFATISEAKFQSLPADIQDALVEAGKAAEEHFCAFSDKSEQEVIETLQTPEYGMTIYRWSDEDVAVMTEKTNDVISTWISDLQARGIPGEAALEAYKAALPQE